MTFTDLDFIFSNLIIHHLFILSLLLVIFLKIENGIVMTNNCLNHSNLHYVIRSQVALINISKFYQNSNQQNRLNNVLGCVYYIYIALTRYRHQCMCVCAIFKIRKTTVLDIYSFHLFCFIFNSLIPNQSIKKDSFNNSGSLKTQLIYHKPFGVSIAYNY